MLNFATYIEYLLMTRHYCYVPGRGAYMLVDEPSSLATTKAIGADSRVLHTIAAPHRIVRFSPLLSHDDGTLASLLMETEGMTFDEACRYIERQAPLLTEEFLKSATIHIDFENYGFEHLSVESWADMEARLAQMHAENTKKAGVTSDGNTKRSDVIEIPKYWLKRAAVAALIGVFFFTNFIGLNQGNTQMASVIDLNVIQRNSMAALFKSAISESVSEPIGQRHPEMVATVPVSPTDIQEDPFEELAEGTTYFIVGFCTWTESYANDVLNRYKSYGYKNAGILVTKDMYRVFVDKFSTKDEALGQLVNIRNENDKLKKSWLLPFEYDGSLSSYIIKNTYNDNQLSMELSHPHQRTERDQG